MLLAALVASWAVAALLLYVHPALTVAALVATVIAPVFFTLKTKPRAGKSAPVMMETDND